MIRVLVVDDHPVVRSGLVGMIESVEGLAVVGEASDGSQVLDLVVGRSPDVVLMDLRMPGLDGVSATAQVTAAHPEVAVLVLTTYDQPADIVRAVEAGATGYLLKDAGVDDLIDGIRAAARHETVLAPPLAAHLMSSARHQRSSPAPSPRELEVLNCVARGMSNAAIGEELFITEATVKTHLQRLFAKLEVEDRTRAVTVAYERGLLSPARDPRSR